MRPSGVRRKIILNSGLILGIMALATLYSGLAFSELSKSVEILFRNNLRMENLKVCLDSTSTSLTSYLTAKNSDSLKDYIMYSTRLSEAAQSLNREIREADSLLLQRDMAFLIDSYLADAAASVRAKRGRDVSSYTESYQGSERDAELIRLLISRTEGIFLSDSLAAFSAFNEGMSRVLVSNAILVVAASLMGFMLLVSYSYRFTEPLIRLAEAARAVGRGEYDHELPLPESADEIGTMAAAFSSMQDSIRRAFEEIREKSEIEKNLMAEKMHVLDMEHKLKDAELLALQTQINPHFLFNTLSAGMQLALAEEADRTADFLDKLAGFIRYALKSPSRSVLVSDEIECLERYIWLLRLRFGERYRFEVEVDEAALGVETPALILQPLVENAVTHGLRDRIEGGAVKVAVRLEGDFAVLGVEDSGDGMNADEIARLMGDEEPAAGPGPVGEGGIGLRNVIRRVKLATGGRGRVALDSSRGGGTRIRVFLPLGGLR